jgi:hypothetical protein
LWPIIPPDLSHELTIDCELTQRIGSLLHAHCAIGKLLSLGELTQTIEARCIDFAELSSCLFRPAATAEPFHQGAAQNTNFAVVNLARTM